MVEFSKISLVTPVYNGERFLETAIRSVLDQDYPDLDYWIVDGGSTDGTLDIVRKYEDRLSGWISEPDEGMYDALNKGFRRTTGDIMFWLNSDDIQFPSSLFQVNEVFSAFSDVDWIIGNPVLLDGDGIFRNLKSPRRWSRFDYMAGNRNGLMQEAVFWRRELWDRCGARLDDRYKLAGDHELWLRYFQSGAQLHNLQSVLGGFRRHGESQLSADMTAYNVEVDASYAALDLSDDDRTTIAEIADIKERLGTDSTRELDQLTARMEKLYNFPPRIVYHNDQYRLQPASRWESFGKDVAAVVRRNQVLRAENRRLRQKG